ncbi:SIR2 family protein [Bacillus aquiflavi]|uniref:SIR2 family protein n=1 Tax=Bacillus aquiflavi TaxID=2672567 RepID=A0A6B3W056_9BACI|nr:SIR2 family protein [Bacillus aquiflavi]MBA4537056.1 SIR2 family protein [Bacillus aquiflavi]NEY81353.1 SIR2 family protein [Bacillus aquiflavi]UAC48317.1 SIR2 family protein [Bacillus aquiflavi]
MNIKEFVNKYTNHPVLFVGTGFSLRYIKETFTWDELLAHAAFELKGNDNYYLDLKYKNQVEGKYNYPMIATAIEKQFDETLMVDCESKFEELNAEFYDNMREHKNVSRFKLYISRLLSNYELKEQQQKEILELKKIRKNIGSIITTNYDTFVEDIFEFNTLIGNEILLSNPYGSVYKIHGCVNQPEKIIINNDDYIKFNERYELIRAQLLSLFIHNPIIFLGYSVSDDNIKQILKTIFTYVNPNTNEAEKIRSNFLLVEYEEGSNNIKITDHDIDIDGFPTIRINKLKTDNFLELYEELSRLYLPVSAMDIRKVQNVVKDIYTGQGGIKVSITEDIETLKNGEKVLAIGSLKTIKYEYHTTSEIMEKYFKIIDESNHQLLELIDKHKIQSNQYFPIYGFSKIQPKLKNIDKLKTIQNSKVENVFKGVTDIGNEHGTIDEILSDGKISNSKEILAIAFGIMKDRIELEDAEHFLRNFRDKKTTNYRKLLCIYDYKRYSSEENDL